ncbi:class F sortase [Kitasatospora sp. NPDC088134]|uniref:class F sortase n=1 Tax=Kitasatospora sp. NPDC088134 TaxID=3364071 RepID=UPI00380ACFC8
MTDRSRRTGGRRRSAGTGGPGTDGRAGTPVAADGSARHALRRRPAGGDGRTRAGRRRGRRPRWAPALAAGLLVAGGVTLLAARHPEAAPVRISAEQAAPARAAGSPSAGTPPLGTPPLGTPPPAAVPASPPVRLVIPRIGVDAPVEGVGLNPDGTVEVPTPERADEVGWYRHGPQPGQPGPAVLLGHYDTRKGPAVFHRLPGLRLGDRIDVRRQDGSTLSYRVRELQQYAKNAFPTELVYGDTAGPQLRLITCGGVIGGDGHYTDNIVVFADPAPATPAA